MSDVASWYIYGSTGIESASKQPAKLSCDDVRGARVLLTCGFPLCKPLSPQVSHDLHILLEEPCERCILRRNILEDSLRCQRCCFVDHVAFNGSALPAL